MLEGLSVSRGGLLLFILSVDFHVGLAGGGILSRRIVRWLVLALGGLGIRGDISVTDGFSGLAIVNLIRPLCTCHDQLDPHRLRNVTHLLHEGVSTVGDLQVIVSGNVGKSGNLLHDYGNTGIKD